MSQQGREVVIVEAARTPIGRGDSEKGYYRDTHPNELLGAAYKAVNFGAAFIAVGVPGGFSSGWSWRLRSALSCGS